jgi:hypothetical protein
MLFTLATLSLMGGLAFFASGRTAEPAAPEADPWVGEYLKYARYDKERTGQFGEAQQIKITKGADGYYLSKYPQVKFTEVEKGVLSDRKGGLGKIYLGSAKFADGTRVRILSARFCYEDFILYDVKSEKPARKSEPKGK